MHKQDKHSGVVFNCTICSYKSPRSREVMRHKLRVHDKTTPDFTCEFCGFVTKYTQTLNDHIQSLHDDKTYSCDECSHISKNKRALGKHKLRHRRQSLPCEKCNDTFFSEKKLMVHKKKIHDEKEDNKCDECDYAPLKKGNLVKHKMAIHGDMVFNCDQCVWKTKEQSNLNKHMKSKHPTES